MRPRYKHWRDDLMPTRPVRETTNKVLEMIEEELLDPVEVVRMCLKWMSEDDVKEMCNANEVFWIYEQEDEDDEEVEIEDDDRSELPWDYGRHFD